MDSVDYGQTGCSSSEPFALRVVGESMVPEFRSGHIVIVDPAYPVVSGAFVVVDLGGEVILGRYVTDGSLRRLEFLNPDFEAITLTTPHQIKGVVIQRSGRRRVETRHYDYPGGQDSARPPST